MQRVHTLFAIMASIIAMGGCASSESQTALLSPPPFYVPTTMMVQPMDAPPASASALAWQVLPGANDDLFFVGRPEKAIYTAMPLSEISAFSIFTYDAQRISPPHESGYRHTWLVREGVWFP